MWFLKLSWFCVLVFFCTLASTSVTPDRALAANLQEVWSRDDFVLSLSNIRPKKKQTGSLVETLLVVKFGESRKKVVLMIDKRMKRVIFESFDEDGHRLSEHLSVDSLSVNTPVKNIIILVEQGLPQSRINIYVDCVFQGSVLMKKSFKQLAENEDNKFIEALRERRSRVKIYQTSSVGEALKEERCADNLEALDVSFSHNHSGSDADLVKVETRKRNERYFPDAKYREEEKEEQEVGEEEEVDEDGDYDVLYDNRPNKNRSQRTNYRTHLAVTDYSVKATPRMIKNEGKGHMERSAERGYPNQTNLNYKRVPRRGDIGIQSLDERTCPTDNQLVKTLNELIEVTKRIWKELELNKLETQHLRQLIENCVACRMPIDDPSLG